MSIDSWKAEFYPVTARQLALPRDDPGKNATDLELIDHCIKKWEGLKPENLTKHEIYLTDDKDVAPIWVVGGSAPDFVAINSSSCALCIRHLEPVDEDSLPCDQCPITLSRGASCDTDLRTDPRLPIEPGSSTLRPFSPWHAFYNHGVTEPMLKVLRDARKWVEKQTTIEKKEGAV